MLFLGFCEGRKGVTDARVCLRPLNVISHTRFQAWPLESILVFRPGLKEIGSLLLRLEQQQKRFLKIYFEFAYFSFFLTHLELKR